MKTVKMATIPMCSVCKKKPARYDAPLASAGMSWGYVCVECAESIGANLTVGSVLEEAGPPANPTGKKVRGKDLTSFEDIVMGDNDREIECPECGAIRTVEPDAGYTYTCEDCGVSVRVPCIM